MTQTPGPNAEEKARFNAEYQEWQDAWRRLEKAHMEGLQPDEQKSHAPYLWLQTQEPDATANCGCHLTTYGGNPQFYQCPLHAAAPEMLALIRRVAASAEHHSGPRDYRNLAELLIEYGADARAMLRAVTEGGSHG